MRKNILLLLLTISSAFAQETIIYKNSDTAPGQQENTNKQNVSFEPGVRIPFGKLADVMGPSPELGIWIRGKIHRNDYLDIGGSAFATDAAGMFEYRDRGAD